ncbi:TraR/DksA family transcriptional regulator [Marinobacterium lutimaris]|uniref:TraR/DksA family transcriptional regulator n=1 Tax=Marinobacterium lutimaris TaxID=568106 RepID=UPI000CDE8D2B|nr:TraR/DksA C4-type zinc finger protein [Marinobacterium lutimaris]
MTLSNRENPRIVLQQLRAELEGDLRSLKPAMIGNGRAAVNAGALAEQIEHDIHRVDAALERIHTGLYGYCIGCGEEIEMNHLRADPAVDLCVSCGAKIKRLAHGY